MNKSKHMTGLGYVNSPSGVIDLSTGHLHVDLHPFGGRALAEYTGLETDTDRADAFFNSIFDSDHDTIDRFQRFLGMCLSERVEHKIAVFYGSSISSKSAVCDMIYAVLGKLASYLSPDRFAAIKHENYDNPDHETFRDTFAEEVISKRIMVASDGLYWHDNMHILKEVSGGDTMVVRPRYGKAYEFRPVVKIVIVADKPVPEYVQQDWGMRRRFLVFPFNKRLAHNFDEFCSTQSARATTLQHFLTWMVKGAVSYSKHGLGVPTSAMNLAKEQYSGHL